LSLYSPLLGLGRFFSFLVLYTVGRAHWTGDQPVARTLPAHITTQKHRINAHNTDIHALSGIRTHDPRVPAREDISCLRPLGHCDRHFSEIQTLITTKRKTLQNGGLRNLYSSCITGAITVAAQSIRHELSAPAQTLGSYGCLYAFLL
jgi:hypothetical protein